MESPPAQPGQSLAGLWEAIDLNDGARRTFSIADLTGLDWNGFGMKCVQ